MRVCLLSCLMLLLMTGSASARPARSATVVFDPLDSTLPVSHKEPYRTLMRSRQEHAADSTAAARYHLVTQARVKDSLQVGAALMDYLETRPDLRAGRKPSAALRVQVDRAIAIGRLTPGPDSLFLARAWFIGAEIHMSARVFALADSVHLLALGVRERHLPMDSAILANSYGAISSVHQLMNRRSALDYAERALKINESRAGPDDFRTAISRYTFAASLNQFGQVARATAECLRAVPVIRKRLGEDHPEVPRFVNALAILAKQNGNYLEARRQQEHELALIERRSPADSLALNRYLGLAAEIRNDLGDYENGLTLAEQAVAISAVLFPKGDPRMGIAQIQVARALVGVGQFEAASALFDTLNAGPQGAHGDSSLVEYANLMNAQQVRVKRDTSAALAWVARTLASADSALGIRDAFEAEGARFYLETLSDAGFAARGLPAYERTLAVTTSVYGPTHQAVVRMRETHARALLVAGHPRGPQAARDVARQRRADLRALAQGFSEQEALFVARRDGLALDPVIAAGVARGAGVLDRSEALGALASARGLVLEEMAHRLREGRASRSPEVVAVLDSLRQARRELSSSLLRTEPQWGQAPDAGLALARGRVAEWERGLADRLGGERAADELNAEALAARLSPGEVLVSYVHYQTLGAGTPSNRRLAAFVLHRDGKVEAHDLAEAQALERRVSAWREHLAPRGLDARQLAEATRLTRLIGDSLRRDVWDPLAKSLTGAKRVLVVPDGSLQLVDLAVLPARGKGWLLDRDPLIARLSSERDLFAPSAASQGDLAMVVGDPDFEGSGGTLAAATYRGVSSSCRGFAEVRFQPLPGAREEAREVARRWRDAGIDSVMLLQGADAEEARLKQLAPRLRALHVATHGFFMGEGCAAGGIATRGVGRLTRPASPAAPARRSAPFFSHRPGELAAREQTLRLAGLALAGANRRAQTGATEEDGVLTAEEITTLDLSRTQEVVLSACDTGVGDLSIGEGVFGVQRAFQLAGARHLVMSLWSVEDTSARAWMQAYYTARLVGRQAPAEAARTAARTRLAGLRRSGASEHPSAWAGFIASGR